MLVFDNDWGFRSRILGAMAPLGDSVLFIPRDFWFEVVGGGILGFGYACWGFGGARARGI